MLVLSRREGDEIVIGDNIRVVVLSIDGNVVRLGIRAPMSIPVHRHEVWDMIHQQQKEEGE